jgi:hypothetical protein
MSAGARPAFDGPLSVVEDPAAWYVVAEADPEDWVVCFEKGEGFPAHAWASNMAATFNLRLERPPD